MGRVDWLDSISIGVAAGTSGALIGHALKFGAEAAAIFGFFGALSGASVTVAAAIYISKRDRLRERRQEFDVILEALLPVVENLDGITMQWPKQVGGFTPEFRREIAAAGSNAYQAEAVLGEALQYAQFLDFRQRANVRVCKSVLSGFVKYYEEAVDPNSPDHDFDDELDWFQKVHQVKGFIRILFNSLDSKISPSPVVVSDRSAPPPAT